MSIELTVLSLSLSLSLCLSVNLCLFFSVFSQSLYTKKQRKKEWRREQSKHANIKHSLSVTYITILFSPLMRWSYHSLLWPIRASKKFNNNGTITLSWQHLSLLYYYGCRGWCSVLYALEGHFINNLYNKMVCTITNPI